MVASDGALGEVLGEVSTSIHLILPGGGSRDASSMMP